MKKFINIGIFLFIFALYFMTFLMIYDNFRERKLNSQENNALEIFENKIEKKPEEEPVEQSYSINYNGYTILGRLQIPKVYIDTVILAEQTYAAMNIGVIKSYGVDLNTRGGFVLAGHNFRGSSVFIYYIHRLTQGDTITITDNRGITMNYTVYEVDRYVSPTDVSYLTKTDDYHVTIVTCESGGKSRIIVKAHVVE